MTKKDIPNIITTARIILSPLIVPIIWSGNVGIGIILFIVTALTDAFDGLLARKWEAQSIEGKYLDTIADKEFAFLTLLSAISLNPSLIACLVLEIAISLVNLKSFAKKYPTKSVQVGRIKTGFLSVLTGLAISSPYLVNMSSIISFLMPILVFSTIGLQTAALKNYITNYKNSKEQMANNNTFEEITNKNNQISEYDISEHMKSFTFYNKSFEKNNQIKKLYRDYLIPAKLESKQFNNNQVTDEKIDDKLITNSKVKTKKNNH